MTRTQRLKEQKLSLAGLLSWRSLCLQAGGAELHSQNLCSTFPSSQTWQPVLKILSLKAEAMDTGGHRWLLGAPWPASPAELESSR